MWGATRGEEGRHQSGVGEHQHPRLGGGRRRRRRGLGEEEEKEREGGSDCEETESTTGILSTQPNHVPALATMLTIRITR